MTEQRTELRIINTYSDTIEVAELECDGHVVEGGVLIIYGIKGNWDSPGRGPEDLPPVLMLWPPAGTHVEARPVKQTSTPVPIPTGPRPDLAECGQIEWDTNAGGHVVPSGRVCRQAPGHSGDHIYA